MPTYNTGFQPGNKLRFDRQRRGTQSPIEETPDGVLRPIMKRRRTLSSLLSLGLVCLGLSGLALVIVARLVSDPIASARASLVSWERRAMWVDEHFDPAAAESIATSILADRPLEAEAIKLLAVVAEQRGDKEKAERLMLLANTRSKADIGVHAWLFRRSLETERLEPMLEHLDAMFRMSPALVEKYLHAIEAIALASEGASAFAERLSQDPPWRSAVIRALGERSANPEAPMMLLSALFAGSNPPRPDELNPYLHRLIRDRLYRRAYLLWTRSLPPERLARLGSPFNGQFERTPTGAPFDWTMEAVRGARIGIVAPGAEGGKALSVQFLNSRVPFRHVRQLLLLVPGTYKLHGKARAEGLVSEGKLRWSLSCADDPTPVIGSSEPVENSAGWKDFEFLIDVPARGCRAQWLTLVLETRIPSEQQIVGQVWFDALSATPLTQGS